MEGIHLLSVLFLPFVYLLDFVLLCCCFETGPHNVALIDAC